MHAAALLSVYGWRFARPSRAGPGAAARARKHGSSVASMIAGHLLGLRLGGTGMDFPSPAICIAGVCDWVIAGDAAFVAVSGGVWVILPTIA
jgi:hypothetical protein